MPSDDDHDADTGGSPSIEESDLSDLREEFESLRSEVEEHTVSRSALERDLHRYIHARMRRGHARGWGPYLVLLYGTAMTFGAFYFLAGGWAILAMVVIWLSTLGLYVVMVLVGIIFSVLNIPRRIIERIKRT